MNQYRLLAADDIEITAEMKGRKVEFQTYEGPQNCKILEGVGEIIAIDHTYHKVIIRAAFKRNIYQGNHNVGESDLITINSTYRFPQGSVPGGCCLHRDTQIIQFDYPTTLKHIFRLLP